MSVRVKVKNFQSIEDAEIVIDGFVVVCGPNNSGKTALMRAIRGLFTNAPPGSYLRHGANYLSVQLTFGDGTNILWEKGWEKPDKKGAPVNRYVVNGTAIQGVGRGVPPEVEALGVRAITAGGQQIWPQIAEQFDGTLFLINKTGSTVAEALSDVERVGKLTEALKLAEKDNRSVNAELKVRREDLRQVTDKVRLFDGLDNPIQKVNSLALEADALRDLNDQILQAKTYQNRLSQVQSIAQALEGFYNPLQPLQPGLKEMPRRLAEVQGLRDRYRQAQQVQVTLWGFSVTAPNTERVRKLQAVLGQVRAYRDRLEALSRNRDNFQAPQLPPVERVVQTKAKLSEASVLFSRLKQSNEQVKNLAEGLQGLYQELKTQEGLIKTLLGDKGFCPTCKTLHQNGHHHE